MTRHKANVGKTKAHEKERVFAMASAILRTDMADVLIGLVELLYEHHLRQVRIKKDRKRGQNDSSGS